MIPRRFLVRLSLHLTPWTRRSYTAFAVHRQHRIQVPARRNAGGQCTSSLTSRGFTATSRLFRVLSEQPLDVEAFERALRSCWTPLEDSALPENALPCPPHRIGINSPRTKCRDQFGSFCPGLAISGGVDSMALAGLCEHLQKTKPDVYHFHGIVVNHRARPGASQEAAEVQEMLQNMGKISMPPQPKGLHTNLSRSGCFDASDRVACWDRRST